MKRLLLPFAFAYSLLAQTVTVTGTPKTSTNHSTVVVTVEIGKSYCYFDNSYRSTGYFTMNCRSPYGYWSEQLTLDTAQVHGNTPNLNTPVFGYWIDPSTAGYIYYHVNIYGGGPMLNLYLLKNGDYAHAVSRTIPL